MNKQTFKLLQTILANEGKPLAIDKLAKLFNVSIRSVYNYWNEIVNYLLTVRPYPLIVFDNHEFYYNGSSEDLQFLKASMGSLSFYEYRLSAEERKNLILILLAAGDSPIKNSFLEDALCVSRNTIIADLKEVYNAVKSFKATVADNKHKGTALLADERKRREIILNCLDYFNVEDAFFANTILHPCIAFLNQTLKFDKYRHFAENAVLYAEDELLVKLPDRHFYKLILILIIFIQRAHDAHCIVDDNLPAEQNPDLQAFIAKIYEWFDKDFSVPHETSALVRFSLNRNLGSHIRKNKDNPRYIDVLIHDMLKDIEPYYQQNLTGDTILNEFLSAHINVCYHRTNAGKKADNPYLSNIHIQYPNDFARLKKSIYILENGLNISLSDNEIAYILMHILASVERNNVRQNILNIVVASSTGIASGNYLSTQIKKNFNVNIVATVPTHDIASVIKEHSVDLIIANVPLEDLGIPQVSVNVFLTKKDIAKIHGEIIAINEKAALKTQPQAGESSERPLKLTFLDLLSKNTIKLNGEATTWQQAIIEAGEILLYNHNITVSYIHEMVRLVEKFGPYIVVAPGVAIAHAAPENGTLVPGVAIVRLIQPVQFHKPEFDPVDIIIACAIKNSQEYVNTLLQLMVALRRPGFAQNTRKAKKQNDVIHYLEGLCLTIVNKKITSF